MEVKKNSQWDIVSYGNSIMDLLGHVNDKTIADLQLQKGTAKMIENRTAKKMLKKLHHVPWKKSPGGSALNTIRFSAQLGLNNFFAGAVGTDANGKLIIEQLRVLNVNQEIVQLRELPTGTLMSLITPDAERTMAFDLGAAQLFSMQHVHNFDAVKNAKVMHWTAYKLLQPTMMEVIRNAMSVAKQHNTLVSFDFADAFLIQSFKEEMQSLSKQMDVVFMNKDEANAFAGSPENAIDQLKRYVSLIVVKLGKEGCLIYDKARDSSFKVSGTPVKAIDTTGAGDSFASGFLYGLTQRFDTNACGRLGNAVGSRVVQNLGSILEKKDVSFINTIIKENSIQKGEYNGLQN